MLNKKLFFDVFIDIVIIFLIQLLYLDFTRKLPKVDVVSKLNDRVNVQLVRLSVISRYIEFDRTTEFKGGVTVNE